MGSLLSSQEVLKRIDHAGDRDGVAEVGDIRSYTDPSSILSPSEELLQAFLTLNRLCGDSSEFFSIPSILKKCPLVSNGRFDPHLLQKAEEEFILRQFNRLFNNSLSDALLRERYQQFLNFVRKKKIPLVELYNVIEKCPFSECPYLGKDNVEETRLEEVRVDKGQMPLLFQLSLYAAVWDLKNNVKTFSPENLKKYPEWFQKKVAGFEENVLNQLLHWEIVPILGVSGAQKPGYLTSKNAFITPPSNPFPSLLDGLQGLVWHESFHAYRSSQVAAEASWIAERDASLVEALPWIQLKGVKNIQDPRLKDFLLRAWENSRGSSGPEDRKGQELFLEEQLAVYQYALSLLQGKATKSVVEAVRKAKLWHVLNNILGVALSNSPSIPVSEWTPEGKEKGVRKVQLGLEQEIQAWRSKSYLWPPDNPKERIPFNEMARRLNTLVEEKGGEMDKETVYAYHAYMEDVAKYAALLGWWEDFGIKLARLKRGENIENLSLTNHDFPQVFAFIQDHPYVFWIESSPL